MNTGQNTYVTGNDEFNDSFDFFEWSAPYFDDPKEIILELNDQKYIGKKIKQINVIGTVEKVGNCSSRKNVPWAVTACEPIQFVFDDNTTLEILPVSSGRVRISANTIPVGMKKGLNQSNFDGDCFFNEAIGRTIQGISMQVKTITKKEYSMYTINRVSDYVEFQNEYFFRLNLGYPIKMELSQTWVSRYMIKMINGSQETVPVSRLDKSISQTDQIYIENGRDERGTYWICPVCSNKELDRGLFFVDNYGMSIDDGVIDNYLIDYLLKYFDPAIQPDAEEFFVRSYDDYGINYYSIESMKRIIEDIQYVIGLLENDFNNPGLSDLKSRFFWYCSSKTNGMSDVELYKAEMEEAAVVIDFYRRFTSRIESMMRLQEIDIISFAGP